MHPLTITLYSTNYIIATLSSELELLTRSKNATHKNRKIVAIIEFTTNGVNFFYINNLADSRSYLTMVDEIVTHLCAFSRTRGKPLKRLWASLVMLTVLKNSSSKSLCRLEEIVNELYPLEVDVETKCYQNLVTSINDCLLKLKMVPSHEFPLVSTNAQRYGLMDKLNSVIPYVRRDIDTMEKNLFDTRIEPSHITDQLLEHQRVIEYLISGVMDHIDSSLNKVESGLRDIIRPALDSLYQTAQHSEDIRPILSNVTNIALETKSIPQIKSEVQKLDVLSQNIPQMSTTIKQMSSEAKDIPVIKDDVKKIEGISEFILDNARYDARKNNKRLDDIHADLNLIKENVSSIPVTASSSAATFWFPKKHYVLFMTDQTVLPFTCSMIDVQSQEINGIFFYYTTKPILSGKIAVCALNDYDVTQDNGDWCIMLVPGLWLAFFTSDVESRVVGRRVLFNGDSVPQLLV